MPLGELSLAGGPRGPPAVRCGAIEAVCKLARPAHRDSPGCLWRARSGRAVGLWPRPSPLPRSARCYGSGRRESRHGHGRPGYCTTSVHRRRPLVAATATQLLPPCGSNSYPAAAPLWQQQLPSCRPLVAATATQLPPLVWQQRLPSCRPLVAATATQLLPLVWQQRLPSCRPLVAATATQLLPLVWQHGTNCCSNNNSCSWPNGLQ